MALDTTDIKNAAISPAKVSGDEGAVEARSISELIEADKYLTMKENLAKGRKGFRLQRLSPPGTA